MTRREAAEVVLAFAPVGPDGDLVRTALRALAQDDASADGTSAQSPAYTRGQEYGERRAAGLFMALLSEEPMMAGVLLVEAQGHNGPVPPFTQETIRIGRAILGLRGRRAG